MYITLKNSVHTPYETHCLIIKYQLVNAVNDIVPGCSVNQMKHIIDCGQNVRIKAVDTDSNQCASKDTKLFTVQLCLSYL
jgi:hypothetical protein